MSEYPSNSTAKPYYDMDGNEIPLHRLVRKEPDWACSRIRVHATEIQSLQAERDVYREALEKIVSGYSEKGPRVIAQQALSQYTEGGQNERD